MKRILGYLKSAANALLANKFRTFLTMLGVIIGVFAVVALVSLVKGLENFIVGQFDAIGSNLVIVSPGNVSGLQDPSVSFTRNSLREEHVDLLMIELKGKITAISPSIRVTGRISHRSKSEAYSVTGVNEQAPKLFNATPTEGRFLSREDVRNRSRVIVIGPKVKEDLFGRADPIGERVTLLGRNFTVIGVVETPAPGSDTRVYIPYTTVKDLYKLDKITNILLSGTNTQEIDELVRQTKLSLLQELKPDEFTVISQEDILSSVGQILAVVSLLLGAIAGISLFVGGMGIMNIMLVTVNERIGEIGLRKAVGAPKKAIAAQFLIEAGIISLLGGLIGILIAQILTILVQDTVPAEVTGWSVLIALGFSLLVGVGFGTYPAIKAANKDAIEALRSTQ